MAKRTGKRNKRSPDAAFDSEDEAEAAFGDQPRAASDNSIASGSSASSKSLFASSSTLRRSKRAQKGPQTPSDSQAAACQVMDQGDTRNYTQVEEGLATPRPAKRQRFSSSTHHHLMEIDPKIRDRMDPTEMAEHTQPFAEATAHHTGPISMALESPTGLTEASPSTSHEGSPASHETSDPFPDTVDGEEGQVDEVVEIVASMAILPAAPEPTSFPPPLHSTPTAYTGEQWARLQQDAAFREHLNSRNFLEYRAYREIYIQRGYSCINNPSLRLYTTNLPSILSKDVTEFYKSLSEVSIFGGPIPTPLISDTLLPREGIQGFVRRSSHNATTKFEKRVIRAHDSNKRSATTHETEKAARHRARMERLADFPLFVRNMPNLSVSRLPGPPTGNYLHNTTLLLNFGAWLKRVDLWNLAKLGGISHTARWWNDRRGVEEDEETVAAEDDDYQDWANITDSERVSLSHSVACLAGSTLSASARIPTVSVVHMAWM